MENLRIGIVGNIGVGKSTLIDCIQNQPLSNLLMQHYPYDDNDARIHTFPEDFCPEVLDAFYKDPKKNAFIAQMEFLNGRLQRQDHIAHCKTARSGAHRHPKTIGFFRQSGATFFWCI